MAPIRYYLFNIPQSILLLDPEIPTSCCGTLEGDRLPVEVYYMIVDHLCIPSNSDGVIKDDKDETVADLLCLALTCKNAARRIVDRRDYLRCELETKSVLWHDTVMYRQPCNAYLRHLYSETYPGPVLLTFCDKRRREWLRELGGKRLGEWVASGRRRPGRLTMGATVYLPVIGILVGVLLGQLWA